MSSCYHLTDKGKKNEPRNPSGKLIMTYINEGHAPVNSEEIHQMVPEVPNPQQELDSLAKAGFLEKREDVPGPMDFMSKK